MAAETHLRRVRALRRMLLAGAVLLPAAPALGANQCGPPTPPRTSVDCAAGTYPDGIDYDVPAILEAKLEPGVVTQGSSTFRADNSVTVTGATNTLLTSSELSATIFASAVGVTLRLDDVVNTNPGGTAIAAAGAASITADRVVAAGTGVSAGSTFENGPLSVNASSVEAGKLGIVLQTRGGASATVADLVSGGIGLQLDARGGVSVDAGRVTAATVGILASSSIGNISIKAGTVASGNTGISATVSTRGDVTIESGSVRISQAGNGISASAFGNVSITNGSVEVTGDNGTGISAVGFVVRVKTDSVTTTGDGSTGILVNAGTPLVTAGSVATLGRGSDGIRISGSSAPLGLTVTGVVSTRGADSDGIDVSTGGEAILALNSVTAIGPGSDGIRVLARSSVMDISGLVASGQGYAIRTAALGAGGLDGGPTSVETRATAVLRGAVFLGDGDDAIRNSGTFDAIGTSHFSGGFDLFENRPGAIVQATHGATTLLGLEQLRNSGRIEMRDGDAGDALILSGAYAGTGAGRLGLDADFAAGTADRLVTGAATGSTLLDVALLGAAFNRPLLVVDAGPGTAASAFILSPTTDTPYVRTRLFYQAAGNDFFLVQTPGGAVFETSRLGAMTARLWHESADAVAAQLDTVRDRHAGRGAGLWVQGWTATGGDGGVQTFQGPSGPAESFDVSYRQDFDGLQGGFDFRSGSALLGITAGAGRSHARFSASGNPVTLKVHNLGLYAQGRAGPLFFNLLAKRDWADVRIAPGAGLGGRADADLFGIQANIGLRLAAGPIFVEPSAGLAWVKGSTEPLVSGPATIAADADGMRARAGLRVGAKMEAADFAVLPFASLDLFEELDGARATDFTLGDTLRLEDRKPGTRARATGGVSLAAGAFEGFVRGELGIGGERGHALRAGARLRF